MRNGNLNPYITVTIKKLHNKSITLFPKPKGPDALGNFCVFCEKNCHHFRDTSAPGEYFSHQILSSITKLHRRRRPALEQDNFLSGVKTVQILQFARHDLKKKILSAPTITKLKIWQRQILSRFLDGPNKFCQSSASGPLLGTPCKLPRKGNSCLDCCLHYRARKG